MPAFLFSVLLQRKYLSMEGAQTKAAPAVLSGPCQGGRFPGNQTR